MNIIKTYPDGNRKVMTRVDRDLFVTSYVKPAKNLLTMATSLTKTLSGSNQGTPFAGLERRNPATPPLKPGRVVGLSSAIAEAFCKELEESCELCTDWLFKYFDEKGLDKQIAYLFYQKACEERAGLPKRLEGICQK